MATNRKYAQGEIYMPMLACIPTSALSGDPVRVGQIPGVAIKTAASNITVIQRDGIFDLPVKAEGGAIAVGDILYLDDTDENLNNSSSGNVRFGYALEAISNGVTDTILVQVGY